ncbi:MAG: NADH-quinone oxidoreductase subunit J [Thiotrichales bacterium]
MTFQAFLFYFFAGIQVLAAIRMISVRNPVHAALFLVLSFVCAASLWILLEAEFLGLLIVLVYVGAVMVLFLFVVMMLDINIAEMREGFASYLPVAAVIALIMVAQMIWVLTSKVFQASPPAPATVEHSNTEALGEVLYTQYVFQFEVAAVILLVAIVAAIALTLRRRPETKYQVPAEQIKVKREDRVRMVNMKTEKK